MSPPRLPPARATRRRKLHDWTLFEVVVVFLTSLLVLGTVLVGFSFFGPGAEGPSSNLGSAASVGPTSDSGSADPAESTAESTEPVTVDEAEVFVADYLRRATEDPSDAWNLLTTGFQESSGGFDSYLGFWAKVLSATPSNITAMDGGTVSYGVHYEFADGNTDDDQVTLHLVREEGQVKIDAEP